MKNIGYLAMVTFLLLTSTVVAQPGPGGPMMREKIRERIKTIKIWRMTEVVGLTSEQSEKFFPIYNQHQKGFEEFEKRRLDLLKNLDEISGTTDVSDEEIEKMFERLADLDKQILQHKHDFLKKLSGVISIGQQARLMIFEERFNRNLQETIRDIRRELGGQMDRRRP